MAKGTFNTPVGKVRVASQRRFIVVGVDGLGRPGIVKRSDNLETAVAAIPRGGLVLDTIGVGKVRVREGSSVRWVACEEFKAL